MNLSKLLLYGCGQLGMMALARFFFFWILRFADKGGAAPGAEVDPASAVLFSASAVGVVFFAFRIFDGVTDPLAGMFSDAWVRRGRQRRNLLWFSFFLPPLGMALTFLPNASMDPSVRWAVLGAGMLVFFVGYTLYAIPYWSLIDDYAGEDEDARRGMSNMLGAGVLLATAVGFVVSPMLVDRWGFFGAAVAFAIPAALLMVVPYFASPGGGASKPPPPKSGAASPFADFWKALQHRRFLAVLVIFSGSQMSFTVMTAAAPFIVEHLLGGSDGDVPMLLGPFLGTAIPFFVAVPWISRRLGWQKGVVVASLALGGVYAATGVLGEGLLGSPWITAGAVFALGGPTAAVLLGLEAEAITACARERGGDVVSLYFGVYNMVVKGLNGLAMVLTGALIGLSKTEMGSDAIRGMGPMAGGLLALGVVGYFALRPRGPLSPPAAAEDAGAKPA